MPDEDTLQHSGEKEPDHLTLQGILKKQLEALKEGEAVGKCTCTHRLSERAPLWGIFTWNGQIMEEEVNWKREGS